MKGGYGMYVHYDLFLSVDSRYDTELNQAKKEIFIRISYPDLGMYGSVYVHLSGIAAL